MLCLLQELNIWGHPTDFIALQRIYEWTIVAIYVPYIAGSPLGALSGIHQLQIYRIASSGDIIASHLPRCTAEIDCRDSTYFYHVYPCYC